MSHHYKDKGMDLIINIFSLVGSLALFLFGMKTMSEGLEKFAGDRLRSILAAMTKNRVMGVLEKERQQFELLFRAYQFLAIEGDGLRVQVERNALIANPVVRRCGLIIGSVNGNVKVHQVPRSW